VRNGVGKQTRGDLSSSAESALPYRNAPAVSNDEAALPSLAAGAARRRMISAGVEAAAAAGVHVRVAVMPRGAEADVVAAGVGVARAPR